MTSTLSRWLSIAAISCFVLTPCWALDESFGDEMSDISAPSDTDNNASTTDITLDNNPHALGNLLLVNFKKLAVDANANQPDNIKDPLQSFNRKIFKFNTTIDKHMLQPVAKTYKNYTPSIFRSSVGNFFSNLREPWNAVNHMLQGNPKSSFKSLGRFTVNTVTSLGLADPATQIGITSTSEDFGQTLGTWGVKSGPYLMLPLLGPSTLRDGSGMAVDMFARPQQYIDDSAITMGLSGTEAINLRAKLLGVEDLVQGDQYSLLRDLYLQRRQYLITEQNQQSAVDTNTTFGDTGFGDANFGDEDFTDDVDQPIQ